MIMLDGWREISTLVSVNIHQKVLKSTTLSVFLLLKILYTANKEWMS